MTEIERKAIDILEDMIAEGQYNGPNIVARDDEKELKTAIQALKEIQQYRAIETELRERYNANVDIKMLMQHFIETIFKGEKHEGFCILTNEDAKMWEEYRTAVERMKLKKLTQKDRIRAMSDAELEAYMIHSGFCPATAENKTCDHEDDDGECSECIRKWLRSKVEGKNEQSSKSTRKKSTRKKGTRNQDNG